MLEGSIDERTGKSVAMKTTQAGMILIVDDDPRNLGVLSHTLTSAGFEVAAAPNGLRGIQIAKRGKPDLILLDVRMDGIDGFETCRRLKGDPDTSEIPVIFLTASSDKSAGQLHGLKLGAVDYILKPFQEEELLARIQVHVRLRSVMKKLAGEIDERLAAEAALQKLTQELETRVAERTADLEKALDGLRRANAQMATLIRAAQTVAGEVILDKVLDRLLRITREHADARKCVLILVRESGLKIEAAITMASDAVVQGLSTPVEPGADLPVTIVQEVAKTKEAVILLDTREAARFFGDPYFNESRPKSILALPMMYQGELSGVLYIESDAGRQLFTPSHVETLGLLASQAAVAVKVALLYSALRTSNDRLEFEVAHQTEELCRTNELLKVELLERERAEKARAGLQEEIIRAQNARLAELSTPLIPITDDIMVMPLIGAIDAGRARQALEAALRGVQANRTNVVIIDVTGVTMIDSGVATTLMSTAAALRMLGAKAVLTGIRAELAQTLIALDVDLSSVVTTGTLKSGIDYALRQGSGRSARR